MDSLVVSYRKDGVDDRRKVMVVSDLIVGVVKHPKGGLTPSLKCGSVYRVRLVSIGR